MTNDYTIQTVPEFSDDFEYYHFHGTDDGTIAYEGKCPGIFLHRQWSHRQFHGSGSTQSHRKTRELSGWCSRWSWCLVTSRRNRPSIARISWMTPLGKPCGMACQCQWQ